jgi:hypothetical protein
MRKSVNSANRPASPWAVALLFVSSGFAAMAVALLSTGYVPA